MSKSNAKKEEFTPNKKEKVPFVKRLIFIGSAIMNNFMTSPVPVLPAVVETYNQPTDFRSINAAKRRNHKSRRGLKNGRR